MQRASFFYESAIFGCHPTQNSVRELEDIGVRHFYDLTCPDESKITPYVTKYNYVNYPVIDRTAPTDIHSFSTFIVAAMNTIHKLGPGEKVYIHCKGGHGRAGVVVACLLARLRGLSGSQALKATLKYHNDRPEMTSRMRKMGSPQTRSQKDFVMEFLQPLIFAGTDNWLSMCSTQYPLVYRNDTYSCGKDALQEHPGQLKAILQSLLEQHSELQDLLRNTGLRPLVYISRTNSLLGDRGDGSGHNALGLIWMRLRDGIHLC